MPVRHVSIASEQNIGLAWPLFIWGSVEYPKLPTKPPDPIITITPVSVNTQSFTFTAYLLEPPYRSTDTSDEYFFYLIIRTTQWLAEAWHFPGGRYVEKVEHKLTARAPSSVEDDPGISVTLTTILSDPPIGREAPFTYRREDDVIKVVGFTIDGPRTITSFPVTFNVSGAKPKTRVALTCFSQPKAGPKTPQGWSVSPDSIIGLEEGPITDSNGSAQFTVNKPLENGPKILQAYYLVWEQFRLGGGRIPQFQIPLQVVYCSSPLQVEVRAPTPPPTPPPSPRPTPPPTLSLSQILTSLMAIAFLGLVPALLKPKKRASPR